MQQIKAQVDRQAFELEHLVNFIRGQRMIMEGLAKSKVSEDYARHYDLNPNCECDQCIDRSDEYNDHE